MDRTRAHRSQTWSNVNEKGPWDSILWTIQFFQTPKPDCLPPEGLAQESQHGKGEAPEQHHEDEDDMPEADHHDAVLRLVTILDLHPVGRYKKYTK